MVCFTHVAIAAICATSLATARIDSLNITKAAFCPLGPTSAVVGNTGSSGDVTIAATGSGLTVLVTNTPNPAPPSYIGLHGVVSNMVCPDSRHVYCAVLNQGLAIVDLLDPGAPLLAAVAPLHKGGRSCAVSGSHAYVTNEDNDLYAVDIATPSEPTVVDTLTVMRRASGIAIAGNYAYVAVSDSGVQVIDITNPAALASVGNLVLPGYAYGITIVGTYAYVWTHNNAHVVDISSPSSLQYIDSLPRGNEVNALAAYGNKLVAVTEAAGVIEYDLSNPAAPVVGRTIDGVTQSVNVSVAGDRAYVARRDSGFAVLDLSTPAMDIVLDGMVVGRAVDVATSDSIALIAYGRGGMYVFDVSGSGPLGPISVYQGTPEVVSVAAVRNEAYLIGRFTGFVVLDITDPAAVMAKGTADIGQHAANLLAGDGVVYATSRDSGLMIIDVSTPTAPSVLSATPMSTEPRQVAVSTDSTHAYVALGTDGLCVVDISAPAAPSVVSTYTTASDWGLSVTVADTLLYYGNGSRIQIFSITDPANPVLVDSATSVYNAAQIILRDGKLVVAQSNYGLAVFEKKDDAWQKTGEYDDVSWRSGTSMTSYVAIGMWGTRVVAAYESGGVNVLDVHDALVGVRGMRHALHLSRSPRLVLQRNTARLTLDRGGPVSLTVYSLAGKRIRLLECGMLEAGTHTIALGAHGLARGPYAVQLRTNAGAATAHHVLVD